MGSSCHGSAVNEPTRICEDTDSIPGLAQQVKDPTLLWLWCRLAAVAPILALAWELPYAALKRKKKKKKKKKRNVSNNRIFGMHSVQSRKPHSKQFSWTGLATMSEHTPRQLPSKNRQNLVKVGKKKKRLKIWIRLNVK